MLLSLLFPPVCLGCGLLLRPQAPPSLPLCLACTAEQPPLPPWLWQLDDIEAQHAYGGPLLQALGRLKFHGQVAWAGPLGDVLAASPALARPWDDVVPVPLHPARRRARGYNQSALLARAMLRRRPRPRPRLRLRWLARVRDTPPQRELCAADRQTNLEGAFAVPAAYRRQVAGRRVLLVDDVTTTGATLLAARQALLAAGARQAGALALLRTLP